MGTGKNRRKLPGEVQENVIKGGNSAGEQNGSRGEIIGVPTPPNTTFSSGIAQLGGRKEGDLFTKQDPNQGSENGVQGETEAATDARLDSLALPPAAPVALRGRPPVLTPQLIEDLLKMLAIGFTRAQAAAHLRIDRSTIAHAAARDPELKAELKRAEELSELQPQLTIIAEARKNWRAAAWWIEHKAKHHPRQLDAAEKEERHQEQLEQIRRDNEAFEVMCGKKK